MITPADITLTLDRSGQTDPHRDDWNWAAAAHEQWAVAYANAGGVWEMVTYEVPDPNHDAAVIRAHGVLYVLSVRNDETSARELPIENVDARDVEIGDRLWWHNRVATVNGRRTNQSTNPDESENVVTLYFEDGSSGMGLEGHVCYRLADASV